MLNWHHPKKSKYISEAERLKLAAVSSQEPTVSTES
ncbi:DUF2986 domain-containing protein [Pseudomonas sp. LB3P14]